MGTIPLTSVNNPTALRGFKASQSDWNNNWFLKDVYPTRWNDPRKAGENKSTTYQYLWAQLSSDWEPWQPRPTAAPRTPHRSSWWRNSYRHIRAQLGHFSLKELVFSLKFLMFITRSQLSCDSNKPHLPSFFWVHPAEDRANLTLMFDQSTTLQTMHTN